MRCNACVSHLSCDTCAAHSIGFNRPDRLNEVHRVQLRRSSPLYYLISVIWLRKEPRAARVHLGLEGGGA